MNEQPLHERGTAITDPRLIPMLIETLEWVVELVFRDGTKSSNGAHEPQRC